MSYPTYEELQQTIAAQAAEIERLNENRCAQVAALKAVLDKYRDAVNLVSLGMYRKTALDAETCEDVRAFINDAIAFDKATLGFTEGTSGPKQQQEQQVG